MGKRINYRFYCVNGSLKPVLYSIVFWDHHSFKSCNMLDIYGFHFVKAFRISAMLVRLTGSVSVCNFHFSDERCIKWLH